MPRPARRIAITTMSSPSRAPAVVSSGVSTSISASRRSRSASKPISIAASRMRRRNSPDGVARSRSTLRWRATSGWSTTVTSGHASARYSLGAVSEARRNVELKAVDPDPARTLQRALALGADDHGVIVQRDTYFRVGSGRLKLREEQPGEAHLIAYARPDAAAVRVSDYRVVAVPDAPALLAALAETAASTSWSRSGGGCCCGSRCGSTSTRSRGSDRSSSSRRSPRPSPTSSASGRRSRTCARSSASATKRCATGSYADAVRAASGPAPDPELLALAREAAGRAYAPYSSFPVGAAVRTADGRRYAGANVENAAYPQGQCAEASALGAMVAGGGQRVVEVVVAAPSRELCAPCGGCRQRLREFADQDAPIHLANLERVRRTTSLAELLPLSFGPESLG